MNSQTSSLWPSNHAIDNSSILEELSIQFSEFKRQVIYNQIRNEKRLDLLMRSVNEANEKLSSIKRALEILSPMEDGPKPNLIEPQFFNVMNRNMGKLTGGLEGAQVPIENDDRKMCAQSTNNPLNANINERDITEAYKITSKRVQTDEIYSTKSTTDDLYKPSRNKAQGTVAQQQDMRHNQVFPTYSNYRNRQNSAYAENNKLPREENQDQPGNTVYSKYDTRTGSLNQDEEILNYRPDVENGNWQVDTGNINRDGSFEVDSADNHSLINDRDNTMLTSVDHTTSTNDSSTVREVESQYAPLRLDSKFGSSRKERASENTDVVFSKEIETDIKRQKASSSKAVSVSKHDISNMKNLSHRQTSVPQHSLEKSLKSVRDIWNEYAHGTLNKPPLRSLERKFGAKWRNETESRTFLRRKKIYEAIEIGLQKGYCENSIISELESARSYLDKGTKKLRSLQWLCQNIPEKFLSL